MAIFDVNFQRVLSIPAVFTDYPHDGSDKAKIEYLDSCVTSLMEAANQGYNELLEKHYPQDGSAFTSTSHAMTFDAKGDLIIILSRTVVFVKPKPEPEPE